MELAVNGGLCFKLIRPGGIKIIRVGEYQAGSRIDRTGRKQILNFAFGLVGDPLINGAREGSGDLAKSRTLKPAP